MLHNILTLRPESFGLDISDHSLKIAKLEKFGKELQLVSFGEARLPDGIVEKGQIKNIKKLAIALRELIKNAQGKLIVDSRVIMSLPEEQAFAQVIQLPHMALSAVKEAISYEAENYIPYPIETVYLDYTVIPSERSQSAHMDVLLSALTKTVVDSYISMLKEAKLTPQALELESLAMARALIPQETTSFPVLILCLGETKTNLSVFSGRTLRLASAISVTSYNLTNAIAHTLQISNQKAESLKIAYGLKGANIKESKQVFDALVPAMTDLAEQVKEYMEYYTSHATQQHLTKQHSKIQKVLLCGGGALMQGITEFLSKEFGVAVEVGNPWVNILSSQSSRAPILPFADSLRYTTALGLALRGTRVDNCD